MTLSPGSADSVQLDQEDTVMDRLATLLERMWEEPRPSTGRTNNPQTFKPPEFDGKGDVEYFIRQFVEVAEANEWNEMARVLHIRSVLREGAKECGKAEDLGGILKALRARFGTSPREARARLLNSKKEYRTSLQEHAAEIEGLVNLAFGDLPLRHRQELALEHFNSSLGNAFLQRHLLAVRANNLEEAVNAGNEFLQIRPNTPSVVRTVLEEDSTTNVPEINTTQTRVDPMSALLAAIQHLTKEVETLKNSKNTGEQTRRPFREAQCWGCGKTGHIRKKCPSHPWTNATPKSGNGFSPQQ